MDKDKIQQIQFLEQNLQSVLMQKQAFQMEYSENNVAIGEIKKSEEKIYRMIGQLMISVNKDKILDELESKEKLIKARIDALSKQEESLRNELQKIDPISK